jgi:hypothetical protein
VKVSPVPDKVQGPNEALFGRCAGEVQAPAKILSFGGQEREVVAAASFILLAGCLVAACWAGRSAVKRFR